MGKISSEVRAALSGKDADPQAALALALAGLADSLDSRGAASAAPAGRTPAQLAERNRPVVAIVSEPIAFDGKVIRPRTDGKITTPVKAVVPAGVAAAHADAAVKVLDGPAPKGARLGDVLDE